MSISQNKQVLNHLIKYTYIDPMLSLRKYGTMRLSARIYDLKRMGHKIISLPKHTANKKIVAEYMLQKLA